MRCPYCEKSISNVSEMRSKVDELQTSRFFPDDIQDLGEEVVRKAHHIEKFIFSLMELAYRRGQAGDRMDQMEYPDFVDEHGNVLENVIESLLGE